jgi:Cu-processing system permease protein
MTKKLVKYVLMDILRSRMMIIYTLFLLVLSIGFNFFSADSSKAAVSLLNVILLVIPLVSVILSSIHFYNSKEFIKLLMTQPLPRKSIFLAEFIGMGTALSAAFIAGIAFPVLMKGINILNIYMITSGIMLTFIFTAIALLTSVMFNDKAKGIGLSLLCWFFMSVLFDGILLMIYYLLRDFPLDKAVIILTALNPVDITRILVLMQMDISALMGYSGAVYKNLLGSWTGTAAAFILLACWIYFPLMLSLRKFRKKNF